MTQKNYEVFVPKHMKYMEVKLNGIIELETLRALSSEADKFISMYDEKPKVVRVLTDVSEVDRISLHSRKYGSEWAVKHPEFRIAFYGQTLFMKYILNIVININNKKNSMKMFKTKAESIEWLNKK